MSNRPEHTARLGDRKSAFSVYESDLAAVTQSLSFCRGVVHVCQKYRLLYISIK